MRRLGIDENKGVRGAVGVMGVLGSLVDIIMLKEKALGCRYACGCDCACYLLVCYNRRNQLSG